MCGHLEFSDEFDGAKFMEVICRRYVSKQYLIRILVLFIRSYFALEHYVVQQCNTQLFGLADQPAMGKV